MSDQDDETAVWPSSPSALVDTQSCPSCFHRLTAMTCGHCGLVVADPRALRLLELGRSMVQLEAQRQQIIGEIRLTHAHRPFPRRQPGAVVPRRASTGRTTLPSIAVPPACRRAGHARSRSARGDFAPSRRARAGRAEALPLRLRSAPDPTAPDASRRSRLPRTPRIPAARRPRPSAAGPPSPTPAHRAGAAAHRRRLARRDRRDLLPDPRVDRRRHRDEVAHHRRRHARDDGRRVAAAALVADRDRRGHRRAGRHPARARRLGGSSERSLRHAEHGCRPLRRHRRAGDRRPVPRLGRPLPAARCPTSRPRWRSRSDSACSPPDCCRSRPAPRSRSGCSGRRSAALRTRSPRRGPPPDPGADSVPERTALDGDRPGRARSAAPPPPCSSDWSR